MSVIRLLVIIVIILCPTRATGFDGSQQTDWTTVQRVSFSKTADRTGHVVRIHVSDSVDGHSLPVADANGVISVVLFRTRLSQHRVLDNPILPIELYQINQVNQDVVIKLTLSNSSITATAYRDQASNDILIFVALQNEVAPKLPTTDPTSGARWTLDTIVIDAGHGGKDLGAVASNGLREKDIVLDVALKLGSYLKENLGVNVVFTRDSDEFISLQGRGHLANQVGGKLFVSIHANAAPDRSARGTETYFLGLHKSDAAKRVMDRENEVIQFEDDPTTYERMDSRIAVMHTLAQSAYMRQSQFLADLVENQFEERVGRKSRGVKQAGFYVLYGASMPAILVELGFISNSAEASFMASPDGQSYLASAIYRSIVAYKSEYDKGLLLPSNGDK
jgi:N-acetylmuramoyl-L-alanine amidase